jgi:hypothetical protein
MRAGDAMKKILLVFMLLLSIESYAFADSQNEENTLPYGLYTGVELGGGMVAAPYTLLTSNILIGSSLSLPFSYHLLVGYLFPQIKHSGVELGVETSYSQYTGVNTGSTNYIGNLLNADAENIDIQTIDLSFVTKYFVTNVFYLLGKVGIAYTQNNYGAVTINYALASPTYLAPYSVSGTVLDYQAGFGFQWTRLFSTDLTFNVLQAGNSSTVTDYQANTTAGAFEVLLGFKFNI